MRKSTRAVAITGGPLLMATSVAPVFAASHREAPLIAADAAADHTDVFAWVDGASPTKVNLAVNVSPMQDPADGPNFRTDTFEAPGGHPQCPVQDSSA